MTLATELARAQSEEDVKDAYVKALRLKGVFKGLIDIKTDKIWFEAKESPTPALIMFGQLMVYVRSARKSGQPVPPLLAVADRDKAALLQIEHALPILDDDTIVWPASGSKADAKFAAQIAPYLNGHFTTWRIEDNEQEFINTTKAAIRNGQIIKTPITRDNLRPVFDKWMAMVGQELGEVAASDFALLFFADIMHDGNSTTITGLSARLLYDGKKPVFLLEGKTYDLASERGYKDFWAIYDRPPSVEDRHYFLERRGSLLPLDEQRFRGEYYTPLHIVEKAYEQLAVTLGADWQERYIVWDMCCGVGNLEVKHSNYRNVFMSTLEKADIDNMLARHVCAGATIFQYDYLNDDVTDFGGIDYSLTNKLPERLRQAIADAREGKEGAKQVLVLINPPYGEAANSQGNAGKSGIAKTRVSFGMDHLGYSARELFIQFVHRIVNEIPNATLAMFSTLKYINAPNFSEFRSRWDAKYLDGFVVHSKAFDTLSGSFPIGFLIWDLSKQQPTSSITAAALDKKGNAEASKTFFNFPNSRLMTNWLERLKTNSRSIPLKNAVTPQLAHAKVTSWHNTAIGYFFSNSNDVQNTGTKTAMFSSVYSAGNGYHVTRENIWKAAVMFTVRLIIPHDWKNHNDQFLQPSKPLSDEFKADCLVWMLFAGKNLTAGADGLKWNDETWRLVNHFIPYTEVEVGATGRFESDFMVQHLAKLPKSAEAQAVLNAGRDLWRHYHSISFPRAIRQELKLNRPDAGWYQVRKALEAYSGSEPTDFGPLEEAYGALTQKLRPQVYELGFLPS